MASVGQALRRPARSSETRVDVALLISALFLQRFALPFGRTALSLDFVAGAFILLHQFISGRLLIQYDRLLWFLAVALAFTCSLVLNFSGTMLTAYAQFILLCSLFTLSRPSTAEQYKRMLRAFQMLVMILSCLGVAQFLAQFVLDIKKLVMFYGLIPDYLLASAKGMNTLHEIEGSSLLKSNGIFLAEPSNFSQIQAFGILIELLEFRRPRYLLIMALGFLLAYSGTGLMILGIFLPLAGLRHSKVLFSVVLVVMFALGLFATGIINPSVFLSRANEFQTTGTSGFERFVAPFWLAGEFFDTTSLQEMLVGTGPGTSRNLVDMWYGFGMSGWLKPLCEYGIIGSAIFVCFWASCLRGSRCPGLLLAALIFYGFVVASLFTTWVSVLTIVLCTLHGPESRRRRVGRKATSLPALAPAAG